MALDVTHLMRAAAYFLTGEDIDPLAYEHSPEGADAYLKDAYGVRRSHFAIEEWIKPARPELAAALGYDMLLVEPSWYPRLLCIQWVADGVRDVVGGEVRVGNYWRPVEYNTAVGGAAHSAHINGCACDLDFRTRGHTMSALRYLESVWLAPWPLNMGMGIGKGKRRLHFDLFSVAALLRVEAGKPATRWWRYASSPLYAGPTPRLKRATST